MDNQRGGTKVWVTFILLVAGAYYYGYSHIQAKAAREKMKELKIELIIQEDLLKRYDRNAAAQWSNRMGAGSALYSTPYVKLRVSSRSDLVRVIRVLKQEIGELEAEGVDCGMTDEELRKSIRMK